MYIYIYIYKYTYRHLAVSTSEISAVQDFLRSWHWLCGHVERGSGAGGVSGWLRETLMFMA